MMTAIPRNSIVRMFWRVGIRPRPRMRELLLLAPTDLDVLRELHRALLKLGRKEEAKATLLAVPYEFYSLSLFVLLAAVAALLVRGRR